MKWLDPRVGGMLHLLRFTPWPEWRDGSRRPVDTKCGTHPPAGKKWGKPYREPKPDPAAMAAGLAATPALCPRCYG